jgi:ubiquinone/menaquinone biosynthesis C-methylase UbiE
LCRVAGVTFKEADHRKLKFADASFDLVWATETLSYSPDLNQSLSELVRVAKAGGQLMISDFACSRLVDRRQLMALNDTKQLWSVGEWTAAFSSRRLETALFEDWSRHAQDTYARLAEQMLSLDQRNEAVRKATRNMQARIRWIDRGAFRAFVAILRRRP